MKQTVTFLQNCGEDVAGDTRAIEAPRARRLVMTGYARIVETATETAAESAEQVRPAGRQPRTERRG